MVTRKGVSAYHATIQTHTTSQQRPLAGRREMRPNNTGGFGWTLDKWAMLDRFLVLGAEGNKFYVSEQKDMARNAHNVLACIKEDGVRVVNRTAQMVQEGRLPKMAPPLVVLSLCMKHPDSNRLTREAANAAMPSICNIGTHVFDLAGLVKEVGGWGGGTRRAFARWYDQKDPATLAYQLVKYQQRNGYSHRDVLRLCHARPADDLRDMLYAYAAGKLEPKDLDKGSWEFTMRGHRHPGGKPRTRTITVEHEAFRIIEGAERAKQATTAKQIVKLITEYNLPRECVPTNFLNDVEVWDAMLQKMPITATIRNLGKMTSIGLLKPLSNASRIVIERLTNTDQIKRGKVHPVAFLQAIATYGQGHGDKGSLSWSPVAQIKDALDTGFYKAFGALEPTGKRFALGIDISGSMSWGSCCGMSGVKPSMAAAAMAMVAARTEPQYLIGGFAHGFVDLGITAKDSIESVMQKCNRDFGSTNVAALVDYCEARRIEVDCFVVYTDNETNSGTRHPVQALRSYRQKLGIDARLVFCAMESSDFTVADPTDPGMLDCVGFDTATPNIIGEFAKGSF